MVRFRREISYIKLAVHISDNHHINNETIIFKSMILIISYNNISNLLQCFQPSWGWSSWSVRLKMSFGKHPSLEWCVIFLLLPACLPRRVFFAAVGNNVHFSDNCLCRSNDPLPSMAQLSVNTAGQAGFPGVLGVSNNWRRSRIISNMV